MICIELGREIEVVEAELEELLRLLDLGVIVVEDLRPEVSDVLEPPILEDLEAFLNTFSFCQSVTSSLMHWMSLIRLIFFDSSLSKSKQKLSEADITI